MTDAPAPNLKLKALELANIHTAGSHDEVVKRAAAYHAFLSGTTVAVAPKPPATGGTTAAPKTPAAPKPGAAAPKGATAPKPGTTAAPKTPTAPKGATANKPAPQTAAGAPSSDGLVIGDMTRALQALLNSGGPEKREANKATAYEILKTVGGAASAKDVKPALFKAVIDACNKALAAPAATAEDDFGETAPPPPVTDDDTVVDSDPPEQVTGGSDAEDA